jgi:hypothetical protein
MHVVDTRIDRDGLAVVEVRALRGLLDLVAWTLSEHGCRHGADGEGFCLLDPPRWMWLLGVPDRTWSLGGALHQLGQWAAIRPDRLDVIWSREVDPQELVERFGWSSSAIAEALEG